MRKKILFRYSLIVFILALFNSCRTEDELNSQKRETGNIQYGISKQVFLESKFSTILNSGKINNAKGSTSGLSAEELSERLDLEKAHISLYEGEEILHAPVRVFGTYKRSLLSISRNQSSQVYLLTYPDPSDYKLFYITNLKNELLKEVRIGDDGKEIVLGSLNKSSVAAKGGDACTETIYVSCSSGQHSYASGNAGQCEFWHNLSAGTPPTLFTVNTSCGETPSPGGGGGGDPITNPGGPRGGGTSPVGGGGPPKHNFTPSDCVQGIDCSNCNLPGDTNNDCVLSYDEVQALYNPCVKASQANAKAKIILEQTKIKNKTTEATATLSTDTVEKGFNFGTDATGAYTAGNVKTGINNSNIQLPPTDPDFTVTGSVHTHNSIGFDSFSPADLYAFHTANNVNANFSTIFVFGSTGAVYNLSITDLPKFQEFLANYPIAIYLNTTNGDWKNGSSIRVDIENVIQKFVDQGKTWDEAYALANAFVLNKYNMGVAIAKRQSNGTFKTLFVEEKKNSFDPEKTNYEQTDNCNLKRNL
ncbi:hypothetical protein CLU96_2577 [Chryseobacterium sp. 52]|uniref:hypothetical protein n=1 Tax=Chryseobacterium sp. 52 TaxID=2035213 RepID=UPI000C197BC6|nr:hypothetical protein [Chryseobacterium sp. 52]PIF45568.1 hypothetical protein CLU96_2577 [Chryseobacterium sp. 52]